MAWWWRARRERDQVRALEGELGAPIDEVCQTILTDTNIVRAVRGGLAELKLAAVLSARGDVVAVERGGGRGQPDQVVVLADGRRVRIEHKNVDAAGYADGSAKLDLRRASAGEDGRLYRLDAFDVLAVCMHPRTGRWEWRFRAPEHLALREVGEDGGVEQRLDANQRVDATWATDLGAALGEEIGDAPAQLALDLYMQRGC